MWSGLATPTDENYTSPGEGDADENGAEFETSCSGTVDERFRPLVVLHLESAGGPP